MKKSKNDIEKIIIDSLMNHPGGLSEDVLFIACNSGQPVPKNEDPTQWALEKAVEIINKVSVIVEKYKSLELK